MKQKVFGRIWILVLTLLVLTATVLPASAATATQDGLVITLTTDKQQYTAQETITVTMTVENKNTFPMEDVKLDYVLPSGYNFKVQGGSASTIAKLGAGEKATRTLTHTPSKDSSNAQAGNNSLWVLLAVLSAVLVTVLTVLYKKKGKFFSILLCLVLIASMLPVSALAADATKTITVTETVKVDGKDVTIKGTVTYTVPTEEPEATKPTEPEVTTAPTEPEVTTAPTEPVVDVDPLNLANMQIVLPKSATAVETTAAEELNLHLEQMIGKELKIVTEGSETKAGIYIGETEFAKSKNVTYTDNDFGEGWVIKAVNSDLVIRGGAVRGVLYGVYHLLEDEFGVRWYTLWETEIPDLTETGAVLPANYAHSGVPAMEYRDLFTGKENVRDFDSRFFVRNRLNGFTVNESLAYGGEEDFAHPAHVHTIGRVFRPTFTASTDPYNRGWQMAVNPDGIDWYIEHPEWYALVFGQRVADQMCLSNEELAEAYTEAVLNTIEYTYEWADENGKSRPRYFDVSPNDNWMFCKCDDCWEIREKSGDSGYVLQFVNKIAEVVAKEYPEARVETLAYSFYADAPKDDTKPADNLVIRLAYMDMDYLRGIDHEINKDYLEALKAWAKITAPGNLYIWDYNTTWSEHGVFPSMYRHAADFAAFAEYGVNGYFSCTEQANNTDFWDMKMWLQAKLAEDPTQDFDALMDDFIYGYYGSAPGEYIREYLDYVHEKAEACEDYFGYKTDVLSATWLTVEDIIHGNELFNKAFEAAGEDETLLRRLRAARSGLDRVIIENYTRLATEAAAENIKLSDSVTKKEVGSRLYITMTEMVAQRGENYDTNGKKYINRYKKYSPENLANLPE